MSARAEHDRLAAAKDARLLRADLLERVAEPVAMIEAHRAQHRHIGIDDVGRIEPAAESHLEHHGLDRGLAKHIQRRQRVVLEEGQRRSRRAPPRCARTQRTSARIADRHAIDLHALVVAHQVRRGEQADAMSAGAQQRREHAWRSSPCRWCRRRWRPGSASRAGRAARRPRARARATDRWRVAVRALLVASASASVPRATAQAACSGGRFCSSRSSCAMRSRMSRRSTIMSSPPCSSRNSLR